MVVAIPVSGNDTVFYEWHDRMLHTWLAVPQGLRVAKIRFPEPCIDVVRDKAVSFALQNGAKWLFFLDSDVIPPEDVIPRLLSHGKPIVAALYVRRHNPPFNEMLRLTAGTASLRPIMDNEYVDGSLVECDAVGTGCVLIDTSIFELVKPWNVTLDGMSARPQWFMWTEWRLQPGMSEDFAFFVRCRQHGIPIYCDTSLKCKHIGPLKVIPSGKNELQVEFLGQ